MHVNRIVTGFLLLVVTNELVQGKESDLNVYDTISVDSLAETKRNALGAVLMASGVNCGVWAFDRYIQNADYARINFDTVKKNFKRGFVWDNDQIGTNMFMHPYHGSFYFNAARVNGFNFWQSGLFALGGSAMWEFVLENEYPSTNDIITTPIGGMALGEVTHRISDLIIDNRTSGWNRAGREAAVFVISPMRGLSRLINGDSWHKEAVRGNDFGYIPLKIELSIGVRSLILSDKYRAIGIGGASEILLEYGEKYSNKSVVPYSYFRLNASVNAQKSQPILGEFNVIGRLFNYPFIETEKMNLNMGIFQHFNYYDSDTLSTESTKEPFKLGVPALVGVGSMFSYRKCLNGELNCEIFANGVVLGAVQSDYYNVGSRDYNFASGFNVKMGIDYELRNKKLGIFLSHDYYRLYTWNGYDEGVNLKEVDPNEFDVQGDKSKTSIHFTTMKLKTKLIKEFYLTISLLNVLRNTFYENHDRVVKNSFEGKVLLTYRF